MEDLFSAEGRAAELADQAITLVMAYAPKVVLAIITLIVGMWLVNRFVNVLDSKLGKKDPTLNKFLCGLINAILKVLLLISVASMIGIATTSFIAVIGAAGLAVGLALQGSLGNFAGGVLILIFKPFKVGDTIEAQGFLGAVDEISILYTIVNTFDNRRVVIPNGSLSNATLVNVSIYDKRRCDMTFGIGYDDDIDKAKGILKQLMEEDERSLSDPAPRICVGSLGDSSVNLMFRVWVATDNLWPYYWDMQEKVKKAFDAADITIPFPQRDVHMYKAE
ncbi:MULTISPECIES: mechanosensitive ion channel domain-containing protein [unclassified Marinobacter]|jgi:small conductance mechanosensitive channel|uniref:mechanosensitive ion channel family protein n=1 Tax=unclassified Marinobacter TaxID=83889 RepID=UPI00200E1654|nr:MULTISPECIES: mechanosensitive ion channel domain-containing protein [unclassified Marinobacter]MCL1478130.1 mechanosensitive ion channel [Marinobacter sp.]MCL1480085.1 mechanosensitive ion channel [Marinobacter sp.]MCL1484036.1 mechanosensitive ion channel [Marinobacter sp.]MCL1486869.1 mechanosensitive ion channel [Marinobacter sp.]UQG55712.1 mechanosensitive ion channel [Marinobacter sp. M4C]